MVSKGSQLRYLSVSGTGTSMSSKRLLARSFVLSQWIESISIRKGLLIITVNSKPRHSIRNEAMECLFNVAEVTQTMPRQGMTCHMPKSFSRLEGPAEVEEIATYLVNQL